MNQDAIKRGRVCEGVRYRAIRLEVGGAVEDEIARYARLALDAPDRHRIVEVDMLGAVRHDCQEIPVAVDASVAACAAAEQPDLQGAPALHHTNNDRDDRSDVDPVPAPIQRRGDYPRTNTRD